MPRSHSDKQIANWVKVQRTYKNSGKLEAARIQRLEELGFVWATLDEAWNEMFSRMVAYKGQHGDCLVPQSYGDKQLANWVTTQRRFKNTGKLESAREQRLEEQGFVWKARK